MWWGWTSACTWERFSRKLTHAHRQDHPATGGAKASGQKSGQGFYVWQEGKPIKPAAAGLPSADLEDRLILSMLNESMAVLREQVVEDADLLDAAVIFGTGFAPFRGGPLQYARSLGSARVVSKLEQLAAKHGAHFKPDPGWQMGLL
jgi:3-hydroxyacyl-CoA dehydrogenase/enoyl-CoA hydratase/3-hydroxybutyryl-CoA epimerase